MTLDRRTFLQSVGVGALGTLAGATDLLGATAGAAALPEFDAARAGAYWASVRALYPLKPDPVYLNCGGLGPTPQSVLDRVCSTMNEMQEHSEPEHKRVDPAREAMARFLGVQPREVCFTRNATEGNSIIAAGLRLKAGDEVIFESHAHPGGSYPWFNQEQERGIKVRLFEPDATSPEGNLARIQALVTPRTKVIQVSHITCTTGQVMPVRAIAEFAREKGLWFHVDGAQSAGMIPVNLDAIGCSSYAISGHKWLGAPHGTGVLYIRHTVLGQVAVTEIGSYSGELLFLPGVIALEDAAYRHEYGTRNLGLLAGLIEATRLQDQIGRDRIAAHGHELASLLLAELGKVEGIEILTPQRADMRGSMTTFRFARANANQLVEYLKKRHGLRCRPVSEQKIEAVRVSTHVFNSRSECERVIAAVRQAVRDL